MKRNVQGLDEEETLANAVKVKVKKKPKKGTMKTIHNQNQKTHAMKVKDTEVVVNVVEVVIAAVIAVVAIAVVIVVIVVIAEEEEEEVAVEEREKNMMARDKKTRVAIIHGREEIKAMVLTNMAETPNRLVLKLEINSKMAEK